jgi:hypothetical protein
VSESEKRGANMWARTVIGVDLRELENYIKEMIGSAGLLR